MPNHESDNHKPQKFNKSKILIIVFEFGCGTRKIFETIFENQIQNWEKLQTVFRPGIQNP